MANGPIIITPKSREERVAEEAARQDFVPIRIKCPECERVYTIFIKDFDQRLHTLLGQACPACKRFIKETDDPEKLLVDLKDIRDSITKENTNACDRC